MEEGKRLVFRIKEKPSSTLGFALHTDNAFGPGIILNYTHLNSLVEGSRLGLTVDFSGSPQMRGYYDIHVGKKRSFIVSAFLLGHIEKLPLYSNGLDVGDYSHSYVAAGVSLNQSLGTNNLVGAKLYYRYSSLKPTNSLKEVLPGLQYLDNYIFRGPEMALLFRRNSFDNHLYPTRGSRVDVKLRGAYNTHFISNYNIPDSLDIDNQEIDVIDPYWVFTTGLENYLPLSKKVSINTGLGLGLSANEKPFPDNFYLGGYRYNLRTKQVPFVGLNHHELLQGNFLKGKLAIQYEPLPGLYLSALANIILFSDDFTAFLDDILSMEEGTYNIGAGAGFTYKTPVGPVSVYLGSRTDSWNPIWYMNLGFTF